MIPKDRLYRLLQKLRQKTEAGEVNWVPHDEYEYGCQLSLTGLTVELLYQQATPASPDRMRVRVRADELDPTTEEQLAVAEVAAADDPDDENWNLLHGLYQAASKEAYHWDRVLGELESAVNKAGKIGLTHEQAEQLVHANR